MFSAYLSPEQADLRSRARDFGRSEIIPNVDATERDGFVPDSILDAFQAAGFTQYLLDEGTDGTFTRDACVITEELGYACPSHASYLMLTLSFSRLAMKLLPAARGAELRRDYLERPFITSFAASERDAGSDLLAMTVSATRNEDGFRITGRKEYSSNVRRSRFVIVVARSVEGDKRATDAFSWLLVPSDAPGVTIGERWPTFGMRAMDVSPIEFQDVDIPTDHLLGEEGRGLQMMGQHLALSRTGIAATGVGIARRARDLVIEHAKRRRLYGAKLSRLQDYRLRIADMEAEIAAARSLVWLSATTIDSGADAVKEASLAKLYAGEAAMRVTEAASVMLGSIGYTGQTLLEKLFRDARHVAIVEGPAPIHREVIFASMLRNGGY